MKKLLYLFITISLISCDNIKEYFKSQEDKCIEVVQQTKVQYPNKGNLLSELFMISSQNSVNENMTWLDFANTLAKDDPNKKLTWKAKKTKEEGIFIVDFSNNKGWGHKWEVTLAENTVKHINQNQFLSRKYGFSRLDKENNFEVKDITLNKFIVERKKRSENYRDGLFDFGYISKNKSRSNEIKYQIKGKIVNNTDKSITYSKLLGTILVLFPEKTIKSKSPFKRGFIKDISIKKPWKPNTTKEFFLEGYDIEDIYLEYLPEYVFFNIELEAEDPIGFKYDKVIKEIELKDEWKKHMKNKSL